MHLGKVSRKGFLCEGVLLVSGESSMVSALQDARGKRVASGCCVTTIKVLRFLRVSKSLSDRPIRRSADVTDANPDPLYIV